MMVSCARLGGRQQVGVGDGSFLKGDIMEITRIWAMPNKWTFKIKPIRELLDHHSVGNGWADPFCGESNLCEYRNDLNPENTNADYHLEAIDFMVKVPEGLSGVVFDPPYSLTQVSKSYKGMGLKFKGKENPTGGFPRVRDLIPRKLKPGGIVISFGWNSVGMGKNRGFEIITILLVCHGGNRNDTICTVERNIPNGD